MNAHITRLSHKVTSEIEKLQACTDQIAGLLQKQKDLESSIQDGKTKLLLAAAENIGLLDLSPAALIAAINSTEFIASQRNSASDTTGKPDRDLSLPRGSASSDGALTDIIVRFGNHESPRRDMLRNCGLKRDGKKGFWHGKVSRETRFRLVAEFGEEKVHGAEQADNESEVGTKSASEASADHGAVEGGLPGQTIQSTVIAEGGLSVNQIENPGGSAGEADLLSTAEPTANSEAESSTLFDESGERSGASPAPEKQTPAAPARVRPIFPRPIRRR